MLLLVPFVFKLKTNSTCSAFQTRREKRLETRKNNYFQLCINDSQIESKRFDKNLNLNWWLKSSHQLLNNSSFCPADFLNFLPFSQIQYSPFWLSRDPIIPVKSFSVSALSLLTKPRNFATNTWISWMPEISRSIADFLVCFDLNRVHYAKENSK